ncbi:MAG TPA: helix-turn-helix domain-containing protein, partial [Phenylobacterium sp.]
MKSAQRALEILEVFARQRRPLALKEILEELGYPTSSGSALMKSLVALGYLDYDRERRTYFPTMRIAVLGHWVPAALFGEGP